MENNDITYRELVNELKAFQEKHEKLLVGYEKSIDKLDEARKFFSQSWTCVLKQCFLKHPRFVISLTFVLVFLIAYKLSSGEMINIIQKLIN